MSFVRIENTSDLLQCLEMCEDFLALHPFSDAELIATLQNAGHTWKDLYIQFNAPLLSEDYEDEEKKICSRVQGEKEHISIINIFTQIVYLYHVHVQRKNKH